MLRFTPEEFHIETKSPKWSTSSCLDSNGSQCSTGTKSWKRRMKTSSIWRKQTSRSKQPWWIESKTEWKSITLWHQKLRWNFKKFWIVLTHENMPRCTLQTWKSSRINGALTTTLCLNRSATSIFWRLRYVTSLRITIWTATLNSTTVILSHTR